MKDMIQSQPVCDMETLWQEALALGRPSIDWQVGNRYNAAIRLPDRSIIRGRDTRDARDSLADAIRKAQHLRSLS